MKSIPRAWITFLIVSGLVLASCSPSTTLDPAQDTPRRPGTGDASPVLSFSDLELVWPGSLNGCLAHLPAPSLNLCFLNNGPAGPAPQQASLLMSAALLPGSLGAALSSLPGGDWLPPHSLTMTGLPGLSQDSEGIIIVNTNPAPNAAAEGIIIVNNIPASSEIQSAFFIIQNFLDPLTAEGIIIVNNKDGSQALTGATTIHFGIQHLASNNEDQDLGFAQAASDLTQNQYSISAWIDGILEFPALGQIQQMAGEIIWGGLVFDPAPDFKAGGTSSLMEFKAPPNDNIPPPDDNLVGIVWGGMLPVGEGSQGMIIINSLPGSDQDTEGIIIVENKDAIQMIGINLEDKAGDDSSSKGIIIVNTKPAEFLSPGLSWEAAAWSGMPDSGQGNEGIIIINSNPGQASASQVSSPFDFPAGFGLPESMVPMMDKGGFGSGPILFLTASIQEFGLPATLKAGSTNCFEIGLPDLPIPSWGGGGTFPADSFFDVYVDLSQGDKTDDPLTEAVPVTPPDLTLCTPTPIPAVVGPKLPTVAPTIKTSPVPPTATLRTGLPTVTPTPKRAE